MLSAGVREGGTSLAAPPYSRKMGATLAVLCALFMLCALFLIENLYHHAAILAAILLVGIWDHRLGKTYPARL